ncbi:M13 family metallopeptidase [Mariniblastus fucicola]|uniref:Neutral endopeptidase n=1 Tax=Mariniblastus fucicola TaxID=980251 RepID=A0A5B9P9J7_9BACT|nr:M13 family metallopeptidase [Mariniblastus fucicola]QEG21286.1 Neutral endopeptidase [Mariniblastus fucicola]
MNCILRYSLSLLLVLSSAALSHAQDEQTAGLDTTSFNRDIRPQDDLFEFVNGTWLKNTPIPADKSNYGSFTKLADLSEERLKAIVEELSAADHPKGSDEQKVGDFFKAYMDVEKANELGAAPIQEELAKIDALESKEALIEHFGSLDQMGVSTPLGAYISQDAKVSTQYIVHLVQNGTTLPDRDYYLVRHEEKNESARAAYMQYVEKLVELTGSSIDGEEVFAFETRLADASWSNIKLRDAEGRYNKYKTEDLAKLTPGIDWSVLFEASGVEPGDEVIVNTPSYFEKLDEIMQQTSLETLKEYAKFHLIDRFAPYLSEPFVIAHFDLHRKELAGVTEQRPRWKRAIAAISGGRGFGALGEVVGKIYVQRHFKPEAKEKMDRLVKNLLKAFGTSIDGLAWMSDETKAKAKVKLSKIRTKIGYPTKWRDYSALEVEPADLVGNTIRSAKVEHDRQVQKLGKPIDREEWGMTPQTVNAYYNPTKNEIVFPAAILQTPFFSADTPAPLNYGGIGAVIGHEISHAFDDQGSRYDGDGNLNNWWTDADREAFEKLTTQLVEQYDGYEPLPGKFVKGDFTLGENIADLSGLEIAHRAMSFELDGKDPIEVAGWNQDQLFFVGWSRVWARKYREAEMMKRLLTDPHSPSAYRANGPVTNIDAFYKAFDLKEGDQLFKPESQRIKIW